MVSIADYFLFLDAAIMQIWLLFHQLCLKLKHALSEIDES